MTAPALAVVGATLAAVVCTAAWRLHLLSASGAWAAGIVGTAATAAGPAWCVLLLVFFGSSVALTRWRRGVKRARTGDIVDKVDARDVWQVFANGVVFATCALASLVWSTPAIAAAGVGALAAAAADTWATEIGTAMGRQPWSVGTWRRVPPGTSGAVSVPGTLGLVLGAIAMGTVAWVVGFDERVSQAGSIAAVTGALVDTLLGATIQERRHCPACRTATEQRVHRCGTRTERSGGWPWMTNDSVNLVCTVSGAAAAVGVYTLWP